MFTLREGTDARIVLVGGGAGMAPILSLLRALAERGQHPGHRLLLRRPDQKRDLCFEDELRELERTLPSFRYVPALSEPDGEPTGTARPASSPTCSSAGRTSLSGAHAYVCGPPPMVEAAMPVLAGLGVEERRIYYDKFTTTGTAEK